MKEMGISFNLYHHRIVLISSLNAPITERSDHLSLLLPCLALHELTIYQIDPFLYRKRKGDANLLDCRRWPAHELVWQVDWKFILITFQGGSIVFPDGNSLYRRLWWMLSKQSSDDVDVKFSLQTRLFINKSESRDDWVAHQFYDSENFWHN